MRIGTCVEKVFVSPTIGEESTVGILSTNYPLNFGNYFSLAEGGIRIVNFWAENLREIVARLKLDDLELRLVREGERVWGMVCDHRIPADWYNSDLCFTGCRRPTEAVVTEMGKLNARIRRGDFS